MAPIVTVVALTLALVGDKREGGREPRKELFSTSSRRGVKSKFDGRDWQLMENACAWTKSFVFDGAPVA